MKKRKSLPEKPISLSKWVADQRKKKLDIWLDDFFKKLGPDLLTKLDEAQQAQKRAEAETALLKSTLAAMLTSDQKEAAQLCNCPEHVYAIEFIQLWREKMGAVNVGAIMPITNLGKFHG